MTQLKCEASQWSYNKNNLCFLDSIKVGGAQASVSENTCCDSFIKQDDAAFSNSVGEPDLCADIACKAENCVHNSGCKCQADSIQIAGDSAVQNEQTCCSSFKCE